MHVFVLVVCVCVRVCVCLYVLHIVPYCGLAVFRSFVFLCSGMCCFRGWLVASWQLLGVVTRQCDSLHANLSVALHLLHAVAVGGFALVEPFACFGP